MTLSVLVRPHYGAFRRLRMDIDEEDLPRLAHRGDLSLQVVRESQIHWLDRNHFKCRTCQKLLLIVNASFP